MQQKWLLTKAHQFEEVIGMLDILMIAAILGLGALMLGLVRWADSVTQKGSDK
jgi:hypothetical protein